MNDIRYVNNLSTTGDTYRGPSNAIWASCPWDTLSQEPRLGTTFWEDFIVTGSANMSSAYADSIGRWGAYGYAGATINDHAAEGGVVRLAADDDAEGMKLQSTTGEFRFVTTSTLALNQKMWFECRVARSSITTDNIEFFVGLMSPTLTSGLPVVAVPISATDDTLSTSGDLFGFHSVSNSAVRGGPTEVGVAFELTSGTVNYPTNLTTLLASTGQSVLAAGTFVKLGWIFDPTPYTKMVTSATARQTAGVISNPLIRFFVNGIEVPTFLDKNDVQNATAGQAFPTGFLSPVFAVFNTAGSSPGYLACDWVRCAQFANS